MTRSGSAISAIFASTSLSPSALPERGPRREASGRAWPWVLVLLVAAGAVFGWWKARGVADFTQEPTEHFYGIDMGVRDPFGNAIRILQPAKVAPELQ